MKLALCNPTKTVKMRREERGWLKSKYIDEGEFDQKYFNLHNC
jgi:hypothetical protein